MDVQKDAVEKLRRLMNGDWMDSMEIVLNCSSTGKEAHMTIAEANEPIASNIALIVFKKKLLKKDVAAAAGFTQAELCDALNGRRLIKASEIPKLAAALDVPSGELLRPVE